MEAVLNEDFYTGLFTIEVFICHSTLGRSMRSRGIFELLGAPPFERFIVRPSHACLARWAGIVLDDEAVQGDRCKEENRPKIFQNKSSKIICRHTANGARLRDIFQNKKSKMILRHTVNGARLRDATIIWLDIGKEKRCLWFAKQWSVVYQWVAKERLHSSYNEFSARYNCKYNIAVLRCWWGRIALNCKWRCRAWVGKIGTYTDGYTLK